MKPGARCASLAVLLTLVALPPSGAFEVTELELRNGMRVLVVPRPTAPLVAAAWAVRVGSGDEVPGKTGVSHLLEHMMFRGTESIGTRDAPRERQLMERRDRLRRRAASGRLGRRQQEELQEIEAELRHLRIPGEYALVYNQAGAVGMGGLTHRDFTLFEVQVPAGRLEVWFWMESDRLRSPVFRDLGTEAEVVLREEDQRAGSEVADARRRFDRAFWGEHPYAWSTGGRERDVLGLGRAELQAHFQTHYRGANVTLALVGAVSVEEVRRLAEMYLAPLRGLSRRARGKEPSPGLAPHAAEPVVVRETCDCPPQVELRFRTVPFAHPDRPALDLLAGLLNGRTGWLQDEAAREEGLVENASAQHSALRRAGTLSLFAAGPRGTRLGSLREVLEGVIERATSKPVDAVQLEGAKNRLRTEALRQVRSSAALARRLLVFDALGDWRDVERGPERAQAVSVEDVMRVARTYLLPGPDGVALLGPSGG